MTKIKNPTVNKIIEKIGKNYKPEAIYVFGSYAWGKPTKDSDLDLLIIKNTKENFFKRPVTVIKPFLPNYPIAMDVLVYNNNEMKRITSRGSIFINKILTEGKKVYERS